MLLFGHLHGQVKKKKLVFLDFDFGFVFCGVFEVVNVIREVWFCCRDFLLDVDW